MERSGTSYESSFYCMIPMNARCVNIQIRRTLSHCLSQHHSFSFAASNIQSPLSQHHSFSFSASLSITTSLTTSLPRPHCLSLTVSLFPSQPHSLNIQPHEQAHLCRRVGSLARGRSCPAATQPLLHEPADIRHRTERSIQPMQRRGQLDGPQKTQLASLEAIQTESDL